jgi:hypothetical protein
MSISSNQQILICIIIGIIVIFFLYKQSEGFATSTEAINNISSMYNADTLTANSLKVGGISFGNNHSAISFGNGEGYGLSIGKKGAPTISIFDNNWIDTRGTLTAGDIAATNIRVAGTLTTGGGAPNTVSITPGNVNFGNGDGHGLNIGKPGSPSMTVYDNRFTTVYGTLRVTDPVTGARMDYTATGPRAVPASAP